MPWVSKEFSPYALNRNAAMWSFSVALPVIVVDSAVILVRPIYEEQCAIAQGVVGNNKLVQACHKTHSPCVVDLIIVYM